MLDRIIAFSLQNRLLVTIAALVIAVVGTATAVRLPVDVLPDLNRPTVTVMTEVHGMVPEDVERFVTRYVEQAVNGATGVLRLRSSSGLGLSVVQVEFDWGTDVYRNRQIVQEKLQLAEDHLPEGAVPRLAPISSLMGQILQIGVRSRSGETDPTEIRSLVDQRVRLRLLSLPGVAQVTTTGGAPRQLQAIVDADKLRAADVTLEEVAEAIRDANLSASGGMMSLGARGPAVTVTGLVQDRTDLERAVVRHDPVRPVRLEDVARVEFGPAAIRTGDAGVDAGPGVLVTVTKQPDVDTIELTRRLDAEMAEIAPTLPPDLEVLPGIYRQADFIQRSVDNVVEAVEQGALLVVVVLVLFLLNVRTTFITLTAIPLSLGITALVFSLFRIGINTMTLGGIAVAIGSLVDDAIVDVENVFRRLKENRLASPPRSPLAVVFLASSEVRKPILIGTVVVAAVYLPLFALSGMEGRLFTPIGIAYVVSILASLVVALMVTPVLSVWLLPNARATARPADGFLVRGLRAGAERLIRLSLRRPVEVTTLFGAVVVAALVAMSGRGTEFLPPFNEGSAQVNLVLPPGTGLETTTAFGRRLERAIRDVPGVAHLGRSTGRAEGDEHVHAVNFSLVLVSFDEGLRRPREEVIGEIRERLAVEFPGVPTAVEQPLAHTLSHMLSGVAAQVAIKVFGEDLAVLRRVAGDVERTIRGVPGVTDVVPEPQVLVERIEIRPRRTDLARVGLDVRDLAETVELALEGEEVSRLVAGATYYPIVVRLEEKDRRNLDAIGRLRLRAPDGGLLAVADVADVFPSLTSNNVDRENVSRRLVVAHNVEGRSLGEVVADVDRALAPVRAALPPGYAIRISGQFEAQEEATRVMGLLSLVSLVGMLLLLFLHFRSWNLALQTLVSVPMAFVGAVAWVIATDQNLSVATLVGFVALSGIAIRNTILLRDHYLHLLREEGMPFSEEMIVRAGRQRIVPVLMTALSTGIALVPIVLAPDQPGREILYPVASVIVGGLISCTLLDVLITPGVFWLFGRKAALAHVARAAGETSATHALAARLEADDPSRRTRP